MAPMSLTKPSSAEKVARPLQTPLETYLHTGKDLNPNINYPFMGLEGIYRDVLLSR